MKNETIFATIEELSSLLFYGSPGIVIKWWILSSSGFLCEQVVNNMYFKNNRLVHCNVRIAKVFNGNYILHSRGVVSEHCGICGFEPIVDKSASTRVRDIRCE